MIEFSCVIFRRLLVMASWETGVFALYFDYVLPHTGVYVPERIVYFEIDFRLPGLGFGAWKQNYYATEKYPRVFYNP